MSTLEITRTSAKPTLAAGSNRQLTDVQAVCLFVVIGLALTGVLFALGFGAEVVQGLSS